MSRLLFLAIIAAVVYWLLKSYRKPPQDRDASAPAEDMVRCAHCGIHLPKHESVPAEGKHYCSEAHRRAHARKSQ